MNPDFEVPVSSADARSRFDLATQLAHSDLLEQYAVGGNQVRQQSCGIGDNRHYDQYRGQNQRLHAAHGDAWLRTGRMKVRFKAPTRPGETVTASAAAAKETDAGAEYAVQCVTGVGEVVIEGRASVGR